MDKDSMKAGERYLFRENGKQVPVVYVGWVPSREDQGIGRHHFIRLDNNTEFNRKSARGLSRHFDDCIFISRLSNCDCKKRLERIK